MECFITYSSRSTIIYYNRSLKKTMPLLFLHTSCFRKKNNLLVRRKNAPSHLIIYLASIFHSTQPSQNDLVTIYVSISTSLMRSPASSIEVIFGAFRLWSDSDRLSDVKHVRHAFASSVPFWPPFFPLHHSGSLMLIMSHQQTTISWRRKKKPNKNHGMKEQTKWKPERNTHTKRWICSEFVLFAFVFSFSLTISIKSSQAEPSIRPKCRRVLAHRIFCIKKSYFPWKELRQGTTYDGKVKKSWRALPKKKRQRSNETVDEFEKALRKS